MGTKYVSKSCNFLPPHLPFNLSSFSYKYFPEHLVLKYLPFTVFLSSGEKTARQITVLCVFLLFHRAFQFTKYNGPTNALVYNKTLI
jgi:hypothetical protein